MVYKLKQAGTGVWFLCVILVVFFAMVNFAWGEDGDPLMGHDAAENIVVARVNSAEINMAMLMEKMMDIAQKKYGRREISDLVAMKIKADAIDELVVEELAYQKALTVVGPPSQKEIEAAIKKLKEQKGGEKGLADFLTRENINRGELQQFLVRPLVVKTFIKKEIDAQITVSDAEIKAAYLGAKGKYFLKHEQVQVTDIVFFLDPDKEESYHLIDTVRAKIIETLENDASRLVPDGTFIVRENMKLDKIENKQLYEIAKGLGPFGLSAPVEIDGTLHVVQLTGYQPEVAKDLEEVRAYLANELKKRKKQEMLDNWVAGLKDGATIEIVDVSL